MTADTFWLIAASLVLGTAIGGGAMWLLWRWDSNRPVANPHAQAKPAAKPGPTRLADPPTIGGMTLRDYALHHARPQRPQDWDDQSLGVWADIVESMYDYVLHDPLVAHHFAGRDGEGLCELKRHFLGALVVLTHVGLTCDVAERLKRQHAHLNITEAEFDATVGYLVQALRDHLPAQAVDHCLPQLTRAAVPALRSRLVRMPVS